MALSELVLDHVADRHQADEPFIPDDRKVARAFIGYFFHDRIDALILTIVITSVVRPRVGKMRTFRR
jgi:hypothetical protein